jgi:platelet-activating factor acetylhydrolase IB subunit alpha
MVLTDRQRADLHAGIYEYFLSIQSTHPSFVEVAAALAKADPGCARNDSAKPSSIPILEKKWTAIPRLQKKVLELERQAAHNAKIHAHRVGTASDGAENGTRRMLPRMPCQHTLSGHASVVTTVKVHPIFTVVVSGSEDGTIKVCSLLQRLQLECDSLFTSLVCAYKRFGITKAAITSAHSKDIPTR